MFKKTSAFCIYDVKTKRYATDSLMFVDHEEDAKRNMYAASKAPGSLLSMFPADYELMYIGEFDENTGTINALEVPQRVCSVFDLIGGE